MLAQTRDFLGWWAEQLGTLVPARWMQPAGAVGDAVILTLGNGGNAVIEAVVRKRGRTRSLGRFNLDDAGRAALRAAAAREGAGGAVILKLPRGALLETQLILPLAAERDLAGLLAVGMDRETPFAADEVYWDAAVVARDRAQRRLITRLSLVPRAPLAPLVDALAAAGLTPTAVAAATADSTAERLIALAHAAAPADTWRARVIPAMAAVCAVLALTAIGLPFLDQSTALSSVEAHIAQLQPAVDEVARLKRQIAGAGREVVAAERARVGDPLRALAAITAALPDDSYLVNLSIRSRKLSLNGRSTSAARLLAGLAGDPSFRAPTFAAPVTKPEGSGPESFVIDAEYAR
jgi:general secretion pathway protein L